MILEELSVGNWVCDGKKSIPMYVTSVHRDGTVYLDFPGNNALDWETDVKDLVPIEVTEEMLLKWGFEKVRDRSLTLSFSAFDKTFGEFILRVIYRGVVGSTPWTVALFYTFPVKTFDFCYVHELQNYISVFTGHPLEIKEL